MKLNHIVAIASMAIATTAFADQSGVLFEVVLLREGKVVASPKVLAEFGKTVAMAQGQVMKFEGTASAPDNEGNSFTAVKLSLFENGEMRQLREMSMLANLTKTPSFEYSVPGTNARFVVMPRLVRLPESKG
jgi:hypothetical protein